MKQDFKYNASKSAVLICRTRQGHKPHFPAFKVSGTNFEFCTRSNYIGHFIADELNDDDNDNDDVLYIEKAVNYTPLQTLHACSASGHNR